MAASSSPLANTLERKVADRLGDWVSVKDFGAKGNGVFNDGPAIQAAINSGRAIYFPPGRYRSSQHLTYGPNGLKLFGAKPELGSLETSRSTGSGCRSAG